ncbi:MAG: hypothetical protein HUU11_07705 [Anaerolineales bacterium]|nr:hypothetical protein [Anaerolineales bacterium]NUQ84582.1 hypothetical protein [Anaerolineales bacterium]
MKKFFYFIVILVLFLTTACRLPGLLLGGNSVPPELQYVFDIPNDPISVKPTLDNETQAEGIFSTAGGTLTATGLDGTVYRLDIPADALLTDTLIRMTPVRQIEGMPFGSDQFAVRFEPEGLQLYANATLTIIPSQEIPIDQQIFFGYQGSGENFVLLPPVVDSPEIKIVIMHFSGAGVSKGFLTDIEPVRARIGGDAERRLQSAMAEKLQKARQEQLLGKADDSLQELDLDGFFKEYEEQVVKPRVAAAGESCAAGRLALQTVLGFERQKQLLGMADDSSSSIDMGLMDTVSDVCMKEEYELCRDDHIIHRILPAWLGLERQYQLLGSEGGPAQEKAKEYVRKCLTFELRFESQGTFNDGEGGGYDSSVESKVKLQFNPNDFSFKGEAPLVNTVFEFRAEGCQVNSVRGGDTFTVNSLAIISDTKSPSDELGYTRDFKLIYYPGNTTESFTVACEDSPPYTSPPTPLWTGIFLPSHESELSEADGGFIAENWEIFGDEYFAKIEWIKETSEGTIEAGTFKLYHKPE